jgi:hypothetical protein
MLYGLFGLFLKTVKIFFMKKIFFSALALFLVNAIQAQTQNIQQLSPEALSLKEEIHDFGMIPQGKPVYNYFEIANKGATPLKLENVVASCGCTTPEWNKEPVAVGGTDKIKVGYNAAAEGPFEKFITITYNGNQTKQIRIKGTVWRAPEGSAPANASVQFLKHQIQ